MYVSFVFAPLLTSVDLSLHVMEWIASYIRLWIVGSVMLLNTTRVALGAGCYDRCRC
jgi:hypothetical protein